MSNDHPALPAGPPRKGGPGSNGTSGRGQREAAMMRQTRALELRAAGQTFDQIAVILGYSNRGAAHRAVEAAMARDLDSIADTRIEYRQLTLARCERLISALWAPALGGHLGAVDRVIKVMEREARLLGLDAPLRYAMTADTRDAVESMIGELEQMLADESDA